MTAMRSVEGDLDAATDVRGEGAPGLTATGDGTPAAGLGWPVQRQAGVSRETCGEPIGLGWPA